MTISVYVDRHRICEIISAMVWRRDSALVCMPPPPSSTCEELRRRLLMLLVLLPMALPRKPFLEAFEGDEGEGQGALSAHTG